MLRSIAMRAASIAAVTSVSALTPLAAGAQDSGASASTFTIEIDLSKIAIAASDFSADEAISIPAFDMDAPFVDQPSFSLGMPDLENAFILSDRRDDVSTNSCASLCDDIAARMAFRIENQDLRVSVGARASVMDGISSSFGSDDGNSKDWYLFVAADAQAMSWTFRAREENTSTVRLDDMRILGDAQAGVGRRVVGGDLAIGFVTREVSHMGAERREDFVGLTFGWQG